MVIKINSVCSKIKKLISKTVNKKMISLKVDIATRLEKSILGINIQYIKDFKICINTISMIQLKKDTQLKF